MSISIVLLLLISVLGTAGTYAAPPSFYSCYDIMGNGASQRDLSPEIRFFTVPEGNDGDLAGDR
jgi:hypothetical protein